AAEAAPKTRGVPAGARGPFAARHSQKHALFHFFHIRDESGEKELPTGRVLTLRSGRADRDAARRLGLPSRSRIWEILRVRALRSVPVIFERIAVPVSLFPDLVLPLDRDLPDELYVLYQEKFAVTVARAEEKLRAVAADPLDAEALGVAVSSPLLEIDRLALSLDGTPVEWRRSRCNTAHHHYFSEID